MPTGSRPGDQPAKSQRTSSNGPGKDNHCDFTEAEQGEGDQGITPFSTHCFWTFRQPKT
jgi:hypothetical protein